MKHYYYKAKNMNGYLDLNHPIIDEEKDNYEEITKEGFDQLTAQLTTD